jgi:hypothetical protein
MTTQEINRYISVANNWERKYSISQTQLLKEQEKLKTIEGIVGSVEKDFILLKELYNNELEIREEHISTLKKKSDRYGTLAFALSAYIIVDVLIKLGVL